MNDPVRALVARWRKHADVMVDEPNSEGFAVAREMCASELEAALAESGWRSMDSAPTDGTLVLCWRKGHGPFEAQWLVDGTEGDEDYFAGWVDPWADDEVVPTHWRPRIDLPGDAP